MFFSRLQAWCIQRVANLGLVAVVLLMLIAFWYDRPSPRDDNKRPGKGQHRHFRDEITTTQLIFVYYTLFAHILGLLFPLRLIWAIRSMTKNLKKVAMPAQTPYRRNSSHLSPLSGSSESGYEDSVSSDFSEAEIELSTTTTESEWDDAPLLHAIIVPNYKEEMDTLRETLDILGSHTQARSSYEIYLAMEQGEAGCEAKAAILIKEYTNQFRSVEFTTHPRDIPGEAQGKSSNLAWAARYINGKYSDEILKRNVIITVLDSDSHLSSKYFTLINGMHFAYPDTADSTMYVPPIIFDRNAHIVPRLVRVADLLWAGAGLSGHYESSLICPPTSVYSLPLSLVDRAGGWDAGVDAIGEDLHMYIKCFFALNGNLTTRSVFSPASHSNVHSNGKGIRGFYNDIMARYKQALRHMWGALDSGFVLRSTINMWWYKQKDSSRPRWGSAFVLLHRMYEAHFLPIHITLLILGSGLYTLFTPSSQIPRLLLQTLDITGYMRILSALNFIYFFFLYESYHHICVKGREKEMLRAGLADRMVDSFSYRNWRKTGLDFCLFPVAGIVFGTVPAAVALVCQFWTLSLVYKVSAKPQRMGLPAP
ncbi:hypothetical protein BDZ45DRAFT_751934 [Acephala macrosclerotiorum]|nr:hypothetical protein BDZ45DRAFT_751934 [Acephala macrosclerotiorum]